MRHFAGRVFLRRCVTISSLFLSLGLSAQDIGVGTWRTHYNYTSAQLLSHSQEKVFCASLNGLFSYDPTQGETRKLSKIDGLSAAGVATMGYSSVSNVLVIGYRSGLVDFVYEDHIETVEDIANSNLTSDKRINDVLFIGNTTYLATGLGIIVLTTADAEIKDNYIQIGAGGKAVEVYELIARNDSLFARTNEGIQSGSLNRNLLDFNNWTQYAGTVLYSDLTVTESGIFALDGANLRQLAGGSWQDQGLVLPVGADRIFNVDGALMTVTNSGEIYQWDGTTFNLLMVSEGVAINDILYFQGTYYLADENLGLLNGAGDHLSPDGPLSDQYSGVKVVENEAYGFHAPSPFGYDGTEKTTGYSLFSSGRWTSETIDGFQNISDVAMFNGIRYFTSIGDGIYDEGSNTIFTDIPLSDPLQDTLFTSIATSFSQLWVAGFNDEEPIHTLLQDGTWESFTTAQVFDNEFVSLDLSTYNVAWAGAASGALTVINLDESTFLRKSTTDGMPGAFLDVAISVEDNVWVGTGQGPATFVDASFVELSPEAIQPTFEGRLLFENEPINAIMTDGGNRVWFGTNRGLWVFNDNITEQEALFNTSNSPLPSNKIVDLTYNSLNGEVFIVTDQGMISYRSASSIGGLEHSAVTVFPNPVRPDYHGMVGINGLAKNTLLKITDINGNLVNEIEANGSTASWDLRTLSGRQVSSGIYLFFSSTNDGGETYVGKIAVIR